MCCAISSIRPSRGSAYVLGSAMAFVLLVASNCDEPTAADCDDGNPCTTDAYIEETQSCSNATKRSAPCEFNGEFGICGGSSGRTCVEFPSSESGRIAFDSDRDGEKNIYVISADGTGDLINMTFGRTNDFDEPAWSPGGNHVVFDTGSVGLRRVSLDGDHFLLTGSPAGSQDDEPSWSPTGDLVAFSSDRDGDQEIYLIPAFGGSVTQLTFNDWDDETPSWSPDGQQIAYQSERDGNLDIFIMGADGSNPVNLTSHQASDEEPAWSPDGSEIVFVSDRDGPDMEIYVMEVANPGNIVRLTDNDALDDEPVWSPDGTKIAFASERDGPANIYVMDADGTNVVPIVVSPADDEDPAWTQ